MRIRCLIIDENSITRERLLSILRENSSIDVNSSETFRTSATAIHSIHPNLIIFRCGDSKKKDDKLLNMIEHLKWQCFFIPLLSQPHAPLIDALIQKKHVVDILTSDTDSNRINSALQKACELLNCEMNGKSYYKGFIGFVGIIPSLRERKILSDAGIGLIQNRSLRLAVDYWRKNPDSQIIGVALNASETFTTRPDELIDCWDDFDLLPWEYGLFEAQRHYLEYWKKPIQDGILSRTIPILLRESGESLIPLQPERVLQILQKVGKLIKDGSIDEIFETMGISFRTESPSLHTQKYDEYINKIEKQIDEVDKKYPELTHPTETGYEYEESEDKKPAVEDNTRMAFLKRKR